MANKGTNDRPCRSKIHSTTPDPVKRRFWCLPFVWLIFSTESAFRSFLLIAQPPWTWNSGLFLGSYTVRFSLRHSPPGIVRRHSMERQCDPRSAFFQRFKIAAFCGCLTSNIDINAIQTCVCSSFSVELFKRVNGVERVRKTISKSHLKKTHTRVNSCAQKLSCSNKKPHSITVGARSFHIRSPLKLTGSFTC